MKVTYARFTDSAVQMPLAGQAGMTGYWAETNTLSKGITCELVSDRDLTVRLSKTVGDRTVHTLTRCDFIVGEDAGPAKKP